eukprot:3105455-Rhodomonas_salina.2
MSALQHEVLGQHRASRSTSVRRYRTCKRGRRNRASDPVSPTRCKPRRETADFQHWASRCACVQRTGGRYRARRVAK